MVEEHWTDWVRKHEIVHEQLDAKLDTILEYVSVIPEMNPRLGRVERTVNEHTGILKVHEQLLREHSAILAEHSADLNEIKHSVRNHDERLVTLESKTS